MRLVVAAGRLAQWMMESRIGRGAAHARAAHRKRAPSWPGGLYRRRPGHAYDGVPAINLRIRRTTSHSIRIVVPECAWTTARCTGRDGSLMNHDRHDVEPALSAEERKNSYLRC